jgi:O-antigen/teichoic acid export membrane protein
VTVFSGIRAILPPQADYLRNSFYKPLPISLRGNEVAQLFTRQESVFQSLQITLLFLVFLKAVNFLKNVFFARLLGPSEFGQLTLFLMIIYIIKQVATFGIGAVHTRYAPEFKLQQALKAFFSKTFVCGAVFISASAITVWVFSRHLALFVFKNSAVTPTVTATILVIVPFAFMELYLSAMQGLRNFKVKSILELSCGVLFLLFGTIGVLTSGKASSAVLGMATAYLLVVVVFSYYFWLNLMTQPVQFRPELNLARFKKLFTFSLFIFLTDISLQIYQFIDRFMLSRFLDSHAVGIYTSCLTMTGIIFPLGLILSEVLLPNLSALWAEGKYDEGRFKLFYHLKLMMIFLLIFSFFLLVTKKQLIILLFGRPYLSGVQVTSNLVAFHIYNSIYWVLAVVPLLVERTYLLFFITLCGISLNAILIYLLIPSFGMQGAALGALFTAISMSAAILLILYYKYRQMDIGFLVLFFIPLVNLFDNPLLLFGILSASAILMTRTNIIFSVPEKKILSEHFSLGLKTLHGYLLFGKNKKFINR